MLVKHFHKQEHNWKHKFCYIITFDLTVEKAVRFVSDICSRPLSWIARKLTVVHYNTTCCYNLKVHVMLLVQLSTVNESILFELWSYLHIYRLCRYYYNWRRKKTWSSKTFFLHNSWDTIITHPVFKLQLKHCLSTRFFISRLRTWNEILESSCFMFQMNFVTFVGIKSTKEMIRMGIIIFAYFVKLCFVSIP